MSITTLTDIIAKVRRLTGTSNTTQLSDAQIIDYINSFYLYDLPSNFKSLQLKNMLTINTVRNIDTYAFDSKHYTSLEAPAYVDKREVPFYTSINAFYRDFFKWQQKEILTTGDGSTGTYSGTTLNAPIIRSQNNNPIADTQLNNTDTFGTTTFSPTFREPNPSRIQNILISGRTATGTVNATDDGAGNIIGGASGSVNYETGSISSLIFDTAIVSGSDIEISYNPSNMARPIGVLFWQNQLIVSPTPDKGYTIEITAYRTPSQILLGSVDPDNPTGAGVPELLEWWETLAAGAAKKVFEDRQDEDGISMMDKMLFERYDLNETRTYEQLASQRVPSIYADQLNIFGNSGLGGFGS